MLGPKGPEKGIQPFMDKLEIRAQFPAAVGAVLCKGWHGRTVAGLAVVGKRAGAKQMIET